MTATEQNILVIDDEPSLCTLLIEELGDRGYLCTTAPDGNSAIAILAVQDFDVVLLDIRLPGISGIEILRRIQRDYPTIAVIMMTAVTDVNIAVSTMKSGASDYIVKPFDLDRVIDSICSTTENRKYVAEEGGLKARILVEEKSKHVPQELSEINAIALGVEVRHDFLTGFSEAVTEETVTIARRLDIPEDIIQRWVSFRTVLDSTRKTAIESSFAKLQRSPFGRALSRGIQLPWHIRNLYKASN